MGCEKNTMYTKQDYGLSIERLARSSVDCNVLLNNQLFFQGFILLHLFPVRFTIDITYFVSFVTMIRLLATGILTLLPIYQKIHRHLVYDETGTMKRYQYSRYIIKLKR